MKVLVLNGSPRKKGTVAKMLKIIVEPLSNDHEIEWIDVCQTQYEILHSMYGLSRERQMRSARG
jgi:multimeric flavodoxin WrbA